MKQFKFFVLLSLLVTLSACSMAPKLPPKPTEILAPEAIQGNTGEYMSPYTSDGVVAEWVDKAINAKLGSTIGGTVAAIGMQQVAGQIPFVGGIVGHYVGSYVGRKIALEMSGGEEFIKETSDLSFNNLNDLSVHTYVHFSSHASYQDALNAAKEIYPDLKKTYSAALLRAPRGVTPDLLRYRGGSAESTVEINALAPEGVVIETEAITDPAVVEINTLDSKVEVSTSETTLEVDANSVDISNN